MSHVMFKTLRKWSPRDAGNHVEGAYTGFKVGDIHTLPTLCSPPCPPLPPPHHPFLKIHFRLCNIWNSLGEGGLGGNEL